MGNSSYDDIVSGADAINKKSEDLLNDVLNLQDKLNKFEEKCHCDHIWFVSKRSHDQHFDECMFQYTCVKCGQIQFLGDKKPGFDRLGDEYYMDVICDSELAINAYRKLIENNPETDDIEAALLLESYIKHYNEEQKAERNGR